MGHRRRRIYSDDASILIACSICGNAFRFPEEIRRCSDGLYRCNVYCTETTTPQSEDRAQSESQRRRNPREVTIPMPGAIKPSWHS